MYSDTFTTEIPQRFMSAATRDIKNCSKEDYEKLCSWSVKPRGNLLFHGLTGRGKTYAACAIMIFLMHKKGIDIHDQKFVNISELNQVWVSNLNDHRQNYDLLCKLKECKVLVIDDLGVKVPSDSFLDFLYTIINHRSDKDEITIITTNLGSKELNEYYGPRILSRIGSGLNIKFTGEDFRIHKF